MKKPECELCAHGLGRENGEIVGQHTYHPTWGMGFWVSLGKPYKYAFLPDETRCETCIAKCRFNQRNKEVSNETY